MAVAFKKDKGWKRLQQMLEPGKADKVLRKHLRRATRLNGAVAEEHIRDTIKVGKYEANAELTQALKGQDKPLIGFHAGAPLFNGITSKMINDTTLFVGVLKTEDVYNIALTLHEGASITVTPAMRGMFYFLSQVSAGKRPASILSGRAAELWALKSSDWYPLKASTTVIIIPARRFIEQAFANKKMRAIAKANWQQAIREGFAEMRSAS